MELNYHVNVRGAKMLNNQTRREFMRQPFKTCYLIMVPSAGGVELLKRTLYGRGQAITNATNASPTVITSNSHGLSNGMSVLIGGVGGNTNCNGGPFAVYNIAANTFQIATVATTTTMTAINGNSAYTSGGFWSLSGMENYALKLYSSNTTPAEGDTAGTYTEVSNGSGYTTGGQTIISALAQISANVWAVPATVAAGGTGAWAIALGTGSTNVPESTATALSWSFSGNVTFYGYFVVGALSGTIAWSERVANPPINASNGSTLTLTPRLGLTHS